MHFWEKLKINIKKNKILFLGIFLFFLYSATTYEIFNRPSFYNIYNLKIFIDDQIPLIKELIVVYHTFSPLFIISGIIVFNYNIEEYKKMLISLFLAQNIAYIIYFFFQTYVPRYDITKLGNDIFSTLIKYTYSIDGSYSGAPSLHVAIMTICSIYIYKLKEFKIFPKILLILYMTLISSTTLLVKQHVFLDVPTGILHAIICYILGQVLLNKFKNIYKKL